MKRTPLKPRSKKMAKVYKDHRIPLIEELKAEGLGCEVCPILRRKGIETHCAGEIQGIHERRKRSSAGSLIQRGNLLASCNWGNEFIEQEPALVRAKTGCALVLRSGDPEWDVMGSGNDARG